jgi:hypothetical protein
METIIKSTFIPGLGNYIIIFDIIILFLGYAQSIPQYLAGLALVYSKRGDILGLQGFLY